VLANSYADIAKAAAAAPPPQTPLPPLSQQQEEEQGRHKRQKNGETDTMGVLEGRHEGCEAKGMHFSIKIHSHLNRVL